jgi:hypothetical protein
MQVFKWICKKCGSKQETKNIPNGCWSFLCRCSCGNEQLVKYNEQNGKMNIPKDVCCNCDTCPIHEEHCKKCPIHHSGQG